jgi:hypothetical protein
MMSTESAVVFKVDSLEERLDLLLFKRPGGRGREVNGAGVESMTS